MDHDPAPGAHLSRLEQQVRFILEVDRLKQVLRRSRLIADHRFENSAEHSWHITLMALLLAEYSNQPIDLLRTVTMLLIHDIVEIDAGDTFAYGDQGEKAANETAAAERLFGLLPADQCAEFTALWREFEERATPESCFANAMDRFMPVLHNLHTDGGSWRDHHVTLAQVIQRVGPIDDGSETVWGYVEQQLGLAVERGILAP